MKKVQKSKDSKDEVQAPHTPKWNNERSDLEQFTEQDGQQQAHAKGEISKDKRRISTKSSPDSRQRSSERLCNANPKAGTVKNNQIKRGMQLASKGGKQLGELMRPKRKLIQKGQSHGQRGTKSQPNTRSVRNTAAAHVDRQTRLSIATQNANQDISDEKNKNKSLPATGPAVEFSMKRHARSQSKRPSKHMVQGQDQHTGQNRNGLGYLPYGANVDDDGDGDSDMQARGDQGNKKYNGHDNLSKFNCSTNIENNSNTKGRALRQISLDGNNNQLAPTTAESKNIVQHHQHLNLLMGISSEQAQSNLGLITPHIDSSNLKTINTTNNIHLLINQQSQLHPQSYHTNQINHKDLAFGISAAANSLLKNNGLLNMDQQHNYLKRPLERSNQKSKEGLVYERSRSRSNRAAVKQTIQATLSSNDKSVGHRAQDDCSSGLSDAEVTMSNLKEADQINIGAKQIGDNGAGSTVDVQIEGTECSKSHHNNGGNMRKGSQLQVNTTINAKRSKDTDRTGMMKAKRGQAHNSNGDDAGKANSEIIYTVEGGKNMSNSRNKRIVKQQNKEAKVSKDTDQQAAISAPGTGRQLRCHKQSGKKTTESKTQPGKQLPIKKRALRTARNNRDKSKDRGGETNGCAVLSEEQQQQQRRQETTVTIFKQADDFAHALNNNSTKSQMAGPIVLSKRYHRDVVQPAQEESDNDDQSQQSNNSDCDDQSSDFQIEQRDTSIKDQQDNRVLQSQVPLISGHGNAQHYNNNAAYQQRLSIQNQIEQLINFGMTNGTHGDNSNSITDSDKQTIENEINKLDAIYQSRPNNMPLTMGLSQLQAAGNNNTQCNQLGLQPAQTQKDSTNGGMTANKFLANLSSLSQLANVAKIFNLNNKVAGTPGNICGSTQLNHQNLQSKSQLGFKTPVPIIGMGQHHQKINYDDSDFNNVASQFRKMPERNNSLQKKDSKGHNAAAKSNNHRNSVAGVMHNDNANSNLQALLNAREQDRQQQEAKKAAAQVQQQTHQQMTQIAQQTQAARAAGLDELDPFTQRYQILKEVGRGAFGSVFKALDRKQAQNSKSQQSSENFVAIKKLFYDRKYEQREVPMLVEIKNKRLNDNIIRLKDRYLKQYQEIDQKKRWQRITKEYLFIVTDYLPHTICDLNVSPSIYLSANGQETAIIPSNVSPQQMASAKAKCLESIRQVMNGVFRGLRDLHSIGITHRDIKLSNILLDNDRLPIQKVKICDLGSSKKLLSNSKDQSTQSLNYIGTRSFRAPELLVGNRYYDTKIDIWSAGVVFLKLLLGYLNKKSNLFNVSDSKGLAKVIVDQIGDPTESELKEMLASNDLMSNSIKQGLSDQDIMKKRFKKLDGQMKSQIPADAVDLLHKILQLSPIRRISAADALMHPYFLHSDLERKESVQKLSMINRTTETTSPCTNPNTMFFANHNNNSHNQQN